MPRRVTPPLREARAVAHATLLRIRDDDAFADVALAHALSAHPLSSVDAALATQLVYGVLAWQGRLDHHLRQLVRTPQRSLDPGVWEALQIGLYQLLFLRVPPYAAVSTTVTLVRQVASAGAASLTNAVLRRAATTPDVLKLPAPARDPLRRLAIEWSHPQWLVERWADEFGVDALPALLAAHNASGEITLRANRQRTTPAALITALAADEIPARPARFAADAVVLDAHAARVRSLPAYREGMCTFQGEASQLVVDLLDPQPGERILDACAAPGGKTTAIAERVGRSGHVVAVDVRASGARRVQSAAARLRLGVDVLVASETAATLPLSTQFDRVLVDAPCSGLGTLRRHPEVRWRRTLSDVTALAAVQSAILARVAPLVRPHGTLVYAVCTRTHEETDAIIDAFLHATPQFTRVDPAPYLPAPVIADGALRTMPFRHELDGFFAIRLQRME